MTINGVNVIKIKRGVDFRRLKHCEIDDENDKVIVQFENGHGTVVYVTGLFEDEDAIACLVKDENGDVFAIGKDEEYFDFMKGYYKLIGRLDLIKEQEEIEGRVNGNL